MQSSDRDPRPVSFPSADGKTLLIGYLWEPAIARPAPAIVMLHGRAGAYSASAKGIFVAKTLSKRHQMWGGFWAERGYVALLVDSFGPRGYASGFPEKSYSKRPLKVSEKDVRPLDAYGAAAWLRAQSLVRPNAIGLQGWSNGAMAGLWAMSWEMLGRFRLEPRDAFRAAITLYPGCSKIAQERPEYQPYAPVLMLLAGKDDEVDAGQCETFAKTVQAAFSPSKLNWHTYASAQHSFDHPDKTDAANALPRAEASKGSAVFRSAPKWCKLRGGTPA